MRYKTENVFCFWQMKICYNTTNWILNENWDISAISCLLEEVDFFHFDEKDKEFAVDLSFINNVKSESSYSCGQSMF